MPHHRRQNDVKGEFPEWVLNAPSSNHDSSLSAKKRYGEAEKIVSRIKEDPTLVRAAEQACNDQRVQNSINHLQDELAKGNDNPGIHKKYLGNNVWEHRARKGGQLYTREIDDKVEILAKSGKRKSNQNFVIKRVKELYVNNNKKN